MLIGLIEGIQNGMAIQRGVRHGLLRVPGRGAEVVPEQSPLRRR
jgi:hypothetical protein